MRLAPTRHAANLNLAELHRLLLKYNYSNSSNNNSSAAGTDAAAASGPTTVQHQEHYAYGTAGFRFLHDELPPILLRVGVAAALLSLLEACEMGVMVTASHNTEDYNGVKLAGRDGGMVDAAAEALVVYVVNERNVETLLRFVEDKLSTGGSATPPTTTPVAVVHLGRDTRAHSASLACLVKQGATHAAASVQDHGVVTTPMLHHCVRHANSVHGYYREMPLAIPVRLHAAGYYELLVQSYTTLLATNTNNHANNNNAATMTPLIVDCACGVGYAHLQQLVQRLELVSQQSPDCRGQSPRCGPAQRGLRIRVCAKGAVAVPVVRRGRRW